jgi:hypothetical protein
LHVEFVATRRQGKRSLGRSKERGEENIYTEFKEVDCEDKGLMAVAYDCVQLRALVTAVLDHRVMLPESLIVLAYREHNYKFVIMCTGSMV